MDGLVDWKENARCLTSTKTKCVCLIRPQDVVMFVNVSVIRLFPLCLITLTTTAVYSVFHIHYVSSYFLYKSTALSKYNNLIIKMFTSLIAHQVYPIGSTCVWLKSLFTTLHLTYLQSLHSLFSDALLNSFLRLHY